MTIQTPEWVKDAVFYQIFPDRFAKSATLPKPANLDPWDAAVHPMSFMGGDLIGVIEKLDYLVDLGITAIYFNPIFQSACNHRYHTHDYYQVDPLLGGNDAFRTLLDEAHARDIKVVIDGVFNHASRGFFQFNMALECGENSPYRDWFRHNAFPVKAYGEGSPNYGAWIGLPALPEFNTDNPEVREFIFSVAEYWMQFGADGWRLDVPECVDDDSFWQEFRRRVKAANPDAYIVGEIWFPAQRWLQGDQFDAVMNYLFTRPAVQFFGAKSLTMTRHNDYDILPLDAPTFAAKLTETMRIYDWEIVLAQLNLLGSHDTARFLTIVGEDASALQLATLCQMTLPGAPCVYYGDELGLTGGEEPGCRGTMPWDKVETLKGDIWQTTQHAIALRKAHPVLRRGSFEVVLAEGEQLVYKRELEGVAALIYFNTAQDSVKIDLPQSTGMTVLYGDPHALEGTLATIPARSGMILLSR